MLILLHDSGGRREQTVACLPRLIEAIRDQGYQVVPLSTLLRKTRDGVMPPLSPRERYVVLADNLSFMLGQWSSFIFSAGRLMLGVFFGLGRFVFYAVGGHSAAAPAQKSARLCGTRGRDCSRL